MLRPNENLKINGTFEKALKSSPIPKDTQTEKALGKTLEQLINNPLKIDGLELMKIIPNNFISTVFFDPQYRGILDKQKYGNEGKTKEKRRLELQQMTENLIIDFLNEIDRILKPSGHLFLWIDKFHLCEGIQGWFSKTKLQSVDLITWAKPRIGMGYRTRNKCEYLMVFQKMPVRVKDCWTRHDIPNLWEESVDTKRHPHAKPIKLQQDLIDATNREMDVVLDPAMGSGSVFEACKNLNLSFIGGDINGSFEEHRTENQ